MLYDKSFLCVVNARAGLLVILLFDVVSNINMLMTYYRRGQISGERGLAPIYFMSDQIKSSDAVAF